MGIFRLLLSMCVLYSHVWGSVGSWNIGVVAVISFFVLSGYVMTLLIRRYYPTREDIPAFYLDRAARLFPQYLFYLLVTLIAALAFKFTDPFLQTIDPFRIGANILLLPLGFYMFGLNDAVYIPPAWSLGLELMFYAVFPVIWLAKPHIRYVLVWFSVLVWLLAYLNILNNDWFGYRLLPGTFFIFAAGAAIAAPDYFGRWMPITAVFVGLVAWICAGFVDGAGGWFTTWTAAGIVLGVPVVFLLSHRRFSAVDEFLGNLAYGVFLNHFLLMLLAAHFKIDRIFVPVTSIFFAWLTYIAIERPALTWRHRLRLLRP